MDWQAIVLTLIAVAGTVGGALGATALSNRHARQERVAAEVRDRSRRVAEPLGRVRILLLDLEPTRTAANINDSMRGVLLDADRRWSGLREDLSIAAAVDGSREITELSTELTIEMSNLINRLSLIMYMQTHPTPGDNDWRPFFEQAKEHYAAAGELTRTLLDHVHGRGATEGQRDLPNPAESPSPASTA